MDRCEKMMITADWKNLSAVLCGENGQDLKLLLSRAWIVMICTCFK